MKLIVLVLARGGSKRLKKKNILKLNKKPLLTWTLKFAKKLPYITNILVSTDDKKIARIAKLNKAYVPWLRPKFLSGDDYTIADIGTFPWIARHVWHDIGLSNYKNLTRWYNDISKREAVIKGFSFMNKDEFPPLP